MFSSPEEPGMHAVDIDVYRHVCRALFASIVTYLNDTSEPMSESLVKIKTSIASFLAAIQELKTKYEASGQSASLKNGVEAMPHISEITNPTGRPYASRKSPPWTRR